MKKAARARDRKEVARLDLDFHALVCKLSGNSRLHRVFVAHAAILRTLLIVAEADYSSLTEIAKPHDPL
jgi:DNA-binding GntR family transcriptional regulator